MRELAAGTRAEVRAAGKRPVWFVEAEFRTVTLRVWSGMGTFQWNGQTWYGPGTAPVLPPGGITGSALVEIEPVTETSSVEATGLKFHVSQFPPALLRYCVDELRVGKQVNVWLGFMNLAGTTLVDDPALWFGGWMDAADVDQNPENARITLTVESELRRLQIPVRRLVTVEDQHIEFPLDNLFKYVAGLKNWKGTWGSRQVQGVGGGGGGGGGCPAPWLMIRLESGLLVSAENLRDGDRVVGVDDLSFDPKSGIVRRPHAIHAERVQVKLEDGRIAPFSVGHRLAVDRKWIAVEELCEGDLLMPGQRVQAILPRSAGTVISFEVEGSATYFADGVLSHNVKPNFGRLMDER